MTAHLRNVNYAYCFAAYLLRVTADYGFVVRVIIRAHVPSITVFALPIFIIVIATNAAASQNEIRSFLNA